MKINLLQSSIGSGGGHRFLASYVVNDVLAIDAGCIGFISPVEDQKQIKHVLLSHTHIDHIASLPIFVDNVYDRSPECMTIYGNEAVLECLRSDIFNDRVWPNMIQMSESEFPFLNLQLLNSETPIEIDNLKNNSPRNQPYRAYPRLSDRRLGKRNRVCFGYGSHRTDLGCGQPNPPS